MSEYQLKPETTFEDLRVHYGTGRAFTVISNGYEKKTHYRSGMMTNLGDIEKSEWISMMKALIAREKEEYLQAYLKEWFRDDPVPQNIACTFKDEIYKTFMTISPIVLYRAWGRLSINDRKDIGAYLFGAYASTEFAESKIDVKLRLSLDPEWKNPRMYEVKLLVPINTIIHAGIVAPITLSNGTIYPGGADQIILPRGWDDSWILGYREITSDQLHVVPNYTLCKTPDIMEWRK